MSITGSSRSGFGRSYSAWQVNEAWRARRREMAQNYRDQSTMAQSALAGAWSSQIEGSASLAAQAAITRIKAATQAVAKTAADLKI